MIRGLNTKGGEFGQFLPRVERVSGNQQVGRSGAAWYGGQWKGVRTIWGQVERTLGNF